MHRFAGRADWLTAERVRRIAVVAALLAAALIAFDFWNHMGPGNVGASGTHLGRDFINTWSGAKLADSGKARTAYDANAFIAYERSQTAPNASEKWYSYPPVAMLLSAPIGLLPYRTALLVWLLGGWATLARMLAPRLGFTMAAIGVLATPAFVWNAIEGQNGVASAALLAGGIMILERRPALAGVLFGLLCYKPHLGLVIPIALIASGRWRTLGAAAATVAAVVALSFLVMGADTWTAFLHNAAYNRVILETEALNWRRMPTIYATVRLLGAGNTMAYTAQAASALAAAAATVVVWRSRAAMEWKGAALIIATFLATPYVWDYDLVVLLFAAVWCWQAAEKSGWRTGEKFTLALMVAAPGLMPTVATPTHVQIGAAILWATLALVVARRGERLSPALPA